MNNKIALICATELILAGCSSSAIVRREGDTAGVERYAQSAGSPVENAPLLIRYEGWRALAADKIVIWANTDVGYLLTVTQPCTGLQSADRIQLTSRDALVRRGVDSVKVAGQSCQIAEIRPVDFRTMKR